MLCQTDECMVNSPWHCFVKNCIYNRKMWYLHVHIYDRIHAIFRSGLSTAVVAVSHIVRLFFLQRQNFYAACLWLPKLQIGQQHMPHSVI